MEKRISGYCNSFNFGNLDTDKFVPAKELLKSFDRRIFAENAPLDLYKARAAKLWARYCTETNQPLPDRFQRYL